MIWEFYMPILDIKREIESQKFKVEKSVIS